MRRKLMMGSLGLALAMIAVVLWQPAFSQTQGLAAAAPSAVAWTGTWAASPQSSGTTFNQQTLRQIVHTSISGTAARVQLSNAFGSQPVTITNVHIAQRTSGSSINTSTDRTVTFGGSTSTTIAAGATAVSDAAPFTVNALSDVAVSFYLPQSTGPATSHQLGNQTNYVSAGDVAGSATLASPQTNGSYYFLANLDVQNAAAEGAVATLGASITDGVGSPGDANRRWPNDLAIRLNGAGRTIGVLNQGISGNRLLADGAGQSAPNRFSRDVLSQPNVKWVIFSDDPINDLGSGNPPTGDQLISATKQLITRAHQAGVKFLCSTLTPFQGSGGWSQTGENGRVAFNAFVRGSGSGCDGVVDQDLATHDPANPTRFQPSLDTGDHLHPNQAGLQAIADAVNLNLFTASPGGTVTGVVSLRAHANGKLVTAENGGAAALIANRTAIGAWEQFDRIDNGNGTIALRAHANNGIVTAANGGGSPLIASASTVGAAERFQVINNTDGSVSLRASVNSSFVCAENAGAASLVANRAAIGAWEEFDLILN